MSENPRQQRMIERVQEDEHIRGDLAGAAATALVQWASDQVAAASADQTQPDEQVEQAVIAIRQVASQTARSGETMPAHVVALAENLLRQHAAQQAAQPQPQVVAATNDVEAPERFGRVRRRWRERIRRWFNGNDS